MSTNILKSSLYSSLLLSTNRSLTTNSVAADCNEQVVKSSTQNENPKSSTPIKKTSFDNCKVIHAKQIESQCSFSKFDKTLKKSTPVKKSIDSELRKSTDKDSKKTKLITKFVNNTDNTNIHSSNDSNLNPCIVSQIGQVEENKKLEESVGHLDNIVDSNLSIVNENEILKKDMEFDIYLRSNLIKIFKDENNEVMISVPCRLNMDLESLFYYFSNNSINLKCKQFAKMLHLSKLYHNSKPIDILGRMFPSGQESLSYEERQIEYNSFLKLLHRFSQFKFRTYCASEEEKLNLVVSFLLNCDYVEMISNKLIKSERCIQIGDSAIQRKEKDIQANAEYKDCSTQFNQSTNSVGISATYSVSDASCFCDIEQELNLTNIQGEMEQPTEEHQNQVIDYSILYVNDQPQSQDVIKHNLNEVDEHYFKKNEKKSSPKKSPTKNVNPESEILVALTSISQEDDKKLFRIFAYYSGPNKDRLSYRQFYNLINDSGLLGGNFEEFLTPIQLERCYSAVIINPKGLDYWEFKEVLLYCGEASSCGNDPTSAFQSIARKYIIPLILVIYQPNNFEKCEDAMLDSSITGGVEETKCLQTMINKAILPWFRLGNRPLLSEEYSDTCSCSSMSSSTGSLDDRSSSTSSSNSSNLDMEEVPVLIQNILK
ncbi:hypothetical protein OJ253_2245 [Cryptosporidium canis]|uniref:Uncharacterized protein n=1 Tax=Cryptosporidium canis TaxID=195482 RepID=A0A9D5DKW6_9CRYT|nr:hypothetical protein OJ253_2245 [Cryptosporidium canis]